MTLSFIHAEVANEAAVGCQSDTKHSDRDLRVHHTIFKYKEGAFTHMRPWATRLCRKN
jgi:hypothetical protein